MPLPLHSRRALGGLPLVILTLALTSCFGGGTSAPADSQSAQQPAAQTPPAAPAADAPRNSLTVRLPAVEKLGVGAEFDYVLGAQCADGLFQGSARVLYDSRVLKPLRAERGGLIPGGAAFIAGSDTAPGTLEVPAAEAAAGYDGVVPFAFTQLPGDRVLDSQPGELLRLRFRIVGNAQPGVAPVKLLNDPNFLQLRNSVGQRLQFSIDTREGGKS